MNLEFETAQPQETPMEKEKKKHWEFRVGDRCPECGEGILDFNSVLALVCPECGYAVGGCFT
jgi:hypothetical protein